MKGRFAIGAFNVNNMELIQGILWAAKERQAPVILQISKGARKYANMRYLRALIDAGCAESPEIPVAIHLDHGDFETAMKCIDEDYTSVMYDGSHETIEKNIADTKKICERAHAHKPYVSVEAELGQLGGIEDGAHGVADSDIEKYLTDPADAQRFVKETGVDWLSVAVGSIHGAITGAGKDQVKFSARLHIEHLRALRLAAGVPLVLHGGSGVQKESVLEGIRNGIAKINIGTEIRQAYEKPLAAGKGEKAAQEAVAAKIEELIVEVYGIAGSRAKLCG